MPRLVCISCGRTVWANASLAMLFAEERRCPRCGAGLSDDRRSAERRLAERRVAVGGSPTGTERRERERRIGQRRRV